MLNIDYDRFIKNLLLTQAYCHVQMSNAVADDTITDIASVLRSFNPEIKGCEIFEFGIAEYSGNSGTQMIKSVHWTTEPHYNYNIIEDLHRDQLADKAYWLEGISLNKEYSGEIAIMKLDISVFDGASAAESYYLFDNEDIPPIDTWFYLLKSKETRLLFAWIPEAYRAYADDAIAVNCVECIGWFSKMYPKEYKQFHQNRLSLKQSTLF